MSDLLAALEPVRTALPFTAAAGDTVSVSKGVVYLNARPLSLLDVLDLSAALARAFNDVAHTNHTNQQEATHG